MPRAILRPDTSVLVVVDVQDKFLEAVHESERVLDRSLFLAKMAHLLGIPVIATEQNPARLGTIHKDFVSLLLWPPIPKMSFSIAGDPNSRAALASTGRRNVVLVGVETHICVALSANELLEGGFQVVVCPDAASSRSQERHKLGMERIRDAGAVPAHTESVAYEWLQSADHPLFKDALQIVKSHA